MPTTSFFIFTVVLIIGVSFLIPTVEALADTSTLKTGDLVLFSSSRKWTRMFLRFTHVGMVVVRDGEKFILEIHQKGDVSQMDTGKVVLYPFWERVLQYHGRVYVAALRNPEALKPSVGNLRQFEYYDEYASHYVKKCIFRNSSSSCKKPPHLVYCSELIGNMLRTPEGLDTECLTPAGLLDLGFHDRPRVVTKPSKMESVGRNTPCCSCT